MTQLIRVTDDTTRADLATTLHILCADAKAIRRKGYIGIRSDAYARQHRLIDAVLDDYWAASA